MKSKKIQTLVAAVIISSMTTTSGLPVFAVPNESTVTTETETEDVAAGTVDNASISKVIQNIQDCDSKIEYKMEKLNELKEQILEKENAIEENEKQIELAEVDIQNKDSALAERLNTIQKNGGIGSTPMKYLDALLSSNDIMDAVQKVHLISKICTSDKKLISEAKDAKENLTEIKKNIEKEQKELENNKQYLENEIKELENDKEKLIDYIKENSGLLDLSTSNIIPVTLPSDISEEAKSLILESEKYLGIPYLWGGTTPAGFDCSGFMQYVFAIEGISLPRVSQDQQSYSTAISMSEIKPGDLVFNKSSNSTHVGMYIGNDMYIHSPHTGDVIKISQLSTSNMKYAGRVLDIETTDTKEN